MTRLKDATFESNAITGTDAFTSSTGSPTVDNTSLIKGTYSARTNWTASANVNGVISGLSESEMWFSFYIRVAALPPSGSSRVIRLNNGSTQFNITLTSAGALNVRMNTTTLQNGITTLSTNTTYRIGIHVKCSTAIGNADAAIDVYITASGSPDAAFGTAVYSNNAVTMNTSNANFTAITFGQDNGGAASGDVYWDNIRVDDVSMPTDDVAGGSDTPKTITVTVTNVLTINKNIGLPISRAVTSTVSRGIALFSTITRTVTTTVTAALGSVFTKNISVAVTTTKTALKTVGKVAILSQAITVSRNTDIPHNVLLNCQTVLFRAWNISKIIPRTVTVNVTGIVGRGYYRTIEVLVTVSTIIEKNILKPVTTSLSTLSTVLRDIGKQVTLPVTKSILVEKGLTKSSILVSSAVLATLSKNIGIIKAVTAIILTTIAMGRGMLITVVITPIVDRVRNIAISKSVTSTLGIFFSKILSNELINATMVKNAKSLILGGINTTLSAVGINTKNLTWDNKNDN